MQNKTLLKRMQAANIWIELNDIDYDSKIGFEWYGQWIVNPWIDDTARFDVNPIEYYGEENVLIFLEKFEREMMGIEYAGSGIFRAYNGEAYEAVLYDSQTMQVVFQSMETGVLHIEILLGDEFTAFMNTVNDEIGAFVLIRSLSEKDCAEKSFVSVDY